MSVLESAGATNGRSPGYPAPSPARSQEQSAPLAPDDALVELRDVFKIYSEENAETVALRGAWLAVQPGERVAILGPSGSGKSTLLALIAGMSAPSAGQVRLGGRLLSALSETERANARRTGLGLVFQRDNLVPFLTARENVALAISDPAGRPERAASLLQSVGLGHRLDHTPAHLSGGEQQRAALAVALANNPPLLLADELTGELDSVTADEVLALLAALGRERGLSVVMVTHNPVVAAGADRCLRVANGELAPYANGVAGDENSALAGHRQPADRPAHPLGPEVLRATDLTRVYPGGVVALRGVSLAASAGESVAVMGPSGCGKSTLLNLLGALDRPTAGTLEISGQPVDGLDPARLALLRRRAIGCVFQAHNLLATLTAAENVALPLLLDGVQENEWRPRVAELLEAVGLAEAAEQLPDQLSGGQRQRVAIARALAHGPKLLLADEPTGSLDSDSAERVTALLVQLARAESMALVLVTHDPRVAAACDRVVQMADGLLVTAADGAPADPMSLVQAQVAR